MPVFADDELIGWSCNMAHWSDIGGSVPGSLNPHATELYQEGLIMPPVKIYQKGVLDKYILSIIKANSRLPDYVDGDFNAGIASVRLGAERLTQLVSKYGKQTYL